MFYKCMHATANRFGIKNIHMYKMHLACVWDLNDRIDLHDVCNKSGSLWQGLHKINGTLQTDSHVNHSQGFFRMTAEGKILSLQQGVTRTSCLDSSDR
jgi:hypothetical protein